MMKSDDMNNHNHHNITTVNDEEQQEEHRRPRVPRTIQEYYTDDIQQKHPLNIVDHRPHGGPLLELLWCSNDDNDDDDDPKGSQEETEKTAPNGVEQENTENKPSKKSLKRLKKKERILQLKKEKKKQQEKERNGATANNSKEQGSTSADGTPSSSKSSDASSLLQGQTLYLGGEIGCDGKIYCIPGHADRVLTIDPRTDGVELIGSPLKTGNGTKFKWLRGIPVNGGTVIYGLPCHADAVLRIEVGVNGDTTTITQLPIPYETFYEQEVIEYYNNQRQQQQDDAVVEEDAAVIAKQQRKMIWKYHGGSISPMDGCIYAIPQSAWHVLKIDPVTDQCTLVGPRLVGKYKWYGGVPTSLESDGDGAIYTVPQNATNVLRITPTSITTHGSWPAGGHKWHGAALSGNGVVVCVSNNVDTVLCIIPGDPEPTLIEIGSSDIIQTGRHRTDRKYKYLGAMAGPNGRVYIFPSGSEHVLEVDTSDKTNMKCRNVGPNLRDTGMERIFQNKWQNGLTNPYDDCVYAIPLAGETLLRIDCSSRSRGGTDGTADDTADDDDVTVTTWPLPSPYETLDKWEGGVLCPNGLMYAVPNNCKAVLKIQPCGWTKEDNNVAAAAAATTTAAKKNDDNNTSNEKKKSNASTPKKPNNKNKQSKTTKNKNDNVRERGDISHLVYKSGIPTLRSSAHRVKFDVKRRKHDPRPRDANGNETGTTWLPLPLLQEEVFPYDINKYGLDQALIKLLQDCDPTIVGSFRTSSSSSDTDKETESTPPSQPKSDSLSQQQKQQPVRLENFQVPINSVWRSVNGGCCEDAQRYLSDRVASDEGFLETFDTFVTEMVLPYVRQRLIDCNAIQDPSTTPTTFYYQRPPTVRLQPGPSWAQVKPHNDAEYGHQNGELNIWVPLTDRTLTGVDLWSETGFKKDDYHPIAAMVGEAISFHGSSCRHYVNPNASHNTRVSLDFRIGVQGYFDPVWSMRGTTDDHTRRKVEV